MGYNMDGYLIVNTKTDADKIERELFAEHCKRMEALGYTVDAQGVVGKNALTGEDMPNAQRTVAASEVEAQDGKFYVHELKNFTPSISHQKGEFIREIKAELITGQIVG